MTQSAPSEAPSCSPFGKKKKYKDKYLAKHSLSKYLRACPLSSPSTLAQGSGLTMLWLPEWPTVGLSSLGGLTPPLAHLPGSRSVGSSCWPSYPMVPLSCCAFPPARWKRPHKGARAVSSWPVSGHSGHACSTWARRDPASLLLLWEQRWKRASISNCDLPSCPLKASLCLIHFFLFLFLFGGHTW